MFKIVSKQVFSSGAHVLDVEAKDLAASFRPGQFIFIMPNEDSVRVAVSSVDVDQRRGTISLIFNPILQDEFQPLSDKKIGDTIHAVSGPYGIALPSLIKENILAIVQGINLASLLSLGRYYKGMNSKVTAVVGLVNRKEVFYDSKLRVSCDKIFFTSLDGSYEKKGTPLILIDELIKKKPDFVYIEGDLAFCRPLCEALLKSKIKIKTVVNLISALKSLYQPYEIAAINFSGREIYPSVDGFMMNAEEINFEELQKKIQQRQEFAEWVKSKSMSKVQPKESGTLRKWFSGLIKETP